MLALNLYLPYQFPPKKNKIKKKLVEFEISMMKKIYASKAESVYEFGT